MKKRIRLFLLACFGLSAGLTLAAWGDTPTATRTATVTPTATATSTPVPPIVVVSLSHNRFNPLAGETVRVTGLRADHGQVTITVFNAGGSLVRKLADHQDAANAAIVWDGRNEQGQMVASGVYLVMVSGNKVHKRFRIAVLK